MTNTKFRATISKADPGQRGAIIKLLQAESLPVEDLPASLNDFFVAKDAGNVIGAIGLERYGDGGLLRSLVVDKAYRNKNIASLLVQALEKSAAAMGITSMYLLTETASQYFTNKGYQTCSRDEVPAELKASSEFSHVCPASAIVMKKQLN
ncbi:GNAT family N-acetyltransferase [Flavisolibacter sp. BT320]|nr:GNAT family N-acetyltransferase [Flavisolibacter longurius]